MTWWVKSAYVSLGILFVLTQNLHANQNQEPIEIKNWNFSIGAFQSIHADYLGSDDYEGSTIPFFDYTYTWDNHQTYTFVRSNEGVGIQTRLGQGIIGTSIGYRNERESSENKALDGLADIDETATANLFYRYGYNQYSGGFLISKGLKNENSGTTVKLHAGCNCKINENLYTSLGAFAIWGDETYMDDYFGVKTSEATMSRPEYKASSGLLNYGIRAGLSYDLDEKQGLILNTSIYKLGDEAARSTFVEEDFGGSITFGYIYMF